MTLHIWHLDRYVEATSELTGRTVYVNQSPNTYLISPAWNHKGSAQVIADWLARIQALRPSNRPPADQRAAVAALASCDSPRAFGAALDLVLLREFKAKGDNEAVWASKRFLTQLMLGLWCKGLVAWPTRIHEPFPTAAIALDNDGWNEAHKAWLTRVRSYLDRGQIDDSVNFRFFVDMLLSRAGVVELGDVTPVTMQYLPGQTRLAKPRPIAFMGVLQALREIYPIKQVPWTPEAFGFYRKKSGHLRRDDEFLWALHQDPSVASWVDLAKQHLAQNPANFKKRRSAVNAFIEYIVANAGVSRNPAGYFDIRRRPQPLFNCEGTQARQTMAVVHQFLDEVLLKVCSQTDDHELPVLMPGFANPLPRLTYRGVNKGETHREPMPTRLIRQAMSILTDDDFAWARKIGRIHDTFRRHDSATGRFQNMWSPVRAYALLAKLMLPARTYQVRHLDSGEGDTLRYGVDGTWGLNTGPHAPLDDDVARGVFRQYRRKDGSLGAVLYFNTNKTGDIDQDETGYVMPWEKRDVLALFARLRDWQEQYNPVHGPTAWADIVEHKAAKHADDLRKRGANHFLFRDPCNRHRPDLPVTDVRLRNLWLKLMEELERRMQQAGQTLASGEPVKLIATRDKGGNASSALFDLHTLRVTMITAMYEAGVPPEILMKIVGHASVIMTLYYAKPGVEAISLQLDVAMQEHQRKAQAEMAGFIQRASRKELEQAVAHSRGCALDAITSGTGTGLVVMDHGLCSVGARRCHEGLALAEPESDLTRFLAVPGGATNCVRCRFFVSGPAFLFGLEAHVVNLSYRLRKASTSFERAQARFDTLSDQFAVALEEATPFAQGRDLEIAETALEASTAEVDAIALSLQAAYALTEQCIRIANRDTDHGGKGSALVACGGVGELQAVLAETHEFEQLQRICTSATLFDGLQINWQQPNLERARLFDRMLRASGREAHFCLLSDEDALNAANEMGRFLYSRLGPRTVHDLIDGRTTLRALGMDKSFATQLDTLTSIPLLAQRPTLRAHSSRPPTMAAALGMATKTSNGVGEEGRRLAYPGRVVGADGTTAAAKAQAPAGVPQPSRARPRSHECHLAGTAHGHALERVERHRRVLLQLGLPPISRMV